MSEINSSNPHAEAYANVIDGIGQLRDYAAHQLSDPGLGFVKTKIDADLRRVQQTLQAMGGLHGAEIASVTGTSHAEDAGPVTNILGKPVDFRKPIDAGATQVGQSERDQFVARRDALIERFGTATDEELLAMLQTPGADKLFRNIAGKLGLDDYRDAEINAFFVGRIRSELKDKAELAEQIRKSQAVTAVEGSVPGEQKLPGALAGMYPTEQHFQPAVTGLPHVTENEPPAGQTVPPAPLTEPVAAPADPALTQTALPAGDEPKAGENGLPVIEGAAPPMTEARPKPPAPAAQTNAPADDAKAAADAKTKAKQTTKGDKEK